MTHEREARIHALAERQHGMVNRTQLIAAGLSASAIGRRVAAGLLRSVHLGVYRLGPIEAPYAPEMAAVLAGGPGALLSHTNALRVWGLSRAELHAPIHVTVPGSGRGKRRGIRFHRVATLYEDERSIVDGIPVTSPTRTLVDVAAILGQREIEWAAAAAEREGLITRDALAALPTRYVGRAGMATLRALIAGEYPPGFTRSEAERRCLDLLRNAGLPRPHTNVHVGPYELDLLWPDEAVAIEIDGRAYHSARHQFEGDRRKDGWLRARGITVVRLTWKQITTEALPTAVQVGQILALQGAGRGRTDRAPPEPLRPEDVGTRASVRRRRSDTKAR